MSFILLIGFFITGKIESIIAAAVFFLFTFIGQSKTPLGREQKIKKIKAKELEERHVTNIERSHRELDELIKEEMRTRKTPSWTIKRKVTDMLPEDKQSELSRKFVSQAPSEGNWNIIKTTWKQVYPHSDIDT